MPDSANLRRDETTLTPLSSNASVLELMAYYFQSPIDLDQFQAQVGTLHVLSADPLVLRVRGNAHVVVLRFGAVVFWGCPEDVRAHLLAKIELLTKMASIPSDKVDTFVVLVDQPEERVNFRDVCLKNLTLEHIRTISESLARSVALRQCESSVSQALRQTTPIVHALEARGELVPSGKSILKTVGFTLSVRDAILSKLNLFDDPAEVAQSERLSRLHNQLYDHFEMKKRLSGLHEKVTFLSDLNQMLMTLLQNRTSHQLEWIVILLIVIEVIFSFAGFLSPFHR